MLCPQISPQTLVCYPSSVFAVHFRPTPPYQVSLSDTHTAESARHTPSQPHNHIHIITCTLLYTHGLAHTSRHTQTHILRQMGCCNHTVTHTASLMCPPKHTLTHSQQSIQLTHTQLNFHTPHTPSLMPVIQNETHALS